MNCPRCSTENSNTNAFCKACGAAIDPKVSALETSIASQLHGRIRETIQAEFRDIKLLEVEIAEAVTERLTKWGKWLCFFMGVPVAALLAILTVLGIASYKEFKTKLSKTEKTAIATMEKRVSDFSEKSKTRMDKLTTETLGRLTQAAEAEANRIHSYGQQQVKTLDEHVEKNPTVQGLKQEVAELKNRFRFIESSMPEATKENLQSKLQQFETYLQKIGFKAQENPPIRLGALGEEHEGPESAVCYYNTKGKKGEPEIFIRIDFANESDLVLWQYASHVLVTERLQSLSVPAEREDYANQYYYAIESGLAAYFTCSFLDRPTLAPNVPAAVARPANLREKGEVVAATVNIEWATSKGAALWGSLYWDIREAIGQEHADLVLRNTWLSIDENKPSDEQPLHFREKFLASAQNIDGGKWLPKLQEILKHRGL
jgi:hypothetical protein